MVVLKVEISRNILLEEDRKLVLEAAELASELVKKHPDIQTEIEVLLP